MHVNFYELGHLFLHMGYKINPKLWNMQENATYYRSGSSLLEYQAYQFAEALFMPQKYTRRSWINILWAIHLRQPKLLVILVFPFQRHLREGSFWGICSRRNLCLIETPGRNPRCFFLHRKKQHIGLQKSHLFFIPFGIRHIFYVTLLIVLRSKWRNKNGLL